MKGTRAWTKQELVHRLRQGQVEFPPAQIQVRKINKELGVDGGLVVKWQEHSAVFAFEYKSLGTPKGLEDAILRLRGATSTGRNHPLPLILVPYLSEAALQRLEEARISGLDLSGNGFLIAPDFALRRSGQPNRFKEPQPQRNIFRGTSSILTRCFLLQPSFDSLVALREFALSRLSQSPRIVSESILTKGTVSKVVRALVEENLVARSKAGLRLCSAPQLLDRLQQNYRRVTRASILGKSPLQPEHLWERLKQSGLAYISTGLGSASQHKVLSQSDTLSLYVDDLDKATECLKVKGTSMFPNVELFQDSSPVVYFDPQEVGLELWASPIQTWLELSLAGPREKAAAEELKSGILRQIAGAL